MGVQADIDPHRLILNINWQNEMGDPASKTKPGCRKLERLTRQIFPILQARGHRRIQRITDLARQITLMFGYRGDFRKVWRRY